jgi:hypothetical protein
MGSLDHGPVRATSLHAIIDVENEESRYAIIIPMGLGPWNILPLALIVARDPGDHT